jgi:hypothetical protein
LGDFGNYDHDGRSSGSRNETSTMIVSNNFHSKKHVKLYLPLPPLHDRSHGCSTCGFSMVDIRPRYVCRGVVSRVRKSACYDPVT